MPYDTYLNLLEGLRTNCDLPPFPEPLPSTQLELELEEGIKLVIDFEEESDQVSFFAEIGHYSQDQELEVLRQVAQANFLWEKTHGATLAARPEAKELSLCYQIGVTHLEENSFISLVERMITTALGWNHFLQDPSNPPQFDQEEETEDLADQVSEIHGMPDYS